MKNKKNINSFMLLLIAMMMLLGVTALTAQTAAPPSNINETGAGTADNPFLISTYENLMWVSANHQYHNGRFYRQDDHIEAPTNPRHNFTPIGNWTNGFRGTYDGDGYEIRNLYISQTAIGIYTGLFGYLGHQQDGARGTILNIGLVNAEVNATSTSNTGSVTYGAGTLVGMAHTATVENCYSINARIDARIDFATGGTIRVGGLIGGVYSDSGSSIIVSNCYFEGTVNTNSSNSNNGSKNIGGIIGLHRGTLQYSYAIATFTGTNNNTNFFQGNIVGSVPYGAAGSWLIWQTGGGSPNLRGNPVSTSDGRTAIEMRLKNLYNSWTFTDTTDNPDNSIIWMINPSINFGLPYQRYIKNPKSTPAPYDLTMELNDLTPTLSWKPPVVPQDFAFLGYNIYRTIGSNTTRIGEIDNVNVTTFEAVPITPAGIHTYHVTAVYEQGETGPASSEEISFALPPANYDDNDAGEDTTNPYKIESYRNLLWLTFYYMDHRDKYFEQTKDIDASISQEYPFTPIGTTPANHFRGHYDGGGYVISNLKIEYLAEFVGLFGYLGYNSGTNDPTNPIGTTVKNLGLINANMTNTRTTGGGSNLGSIAGAMKNATISNSFSIGAELSIPTSEQPRIVGGIVGRSLGSAALENCFASVSITAWHTGTGGNQNVRLGGIAGWVTGEPIELLTTVINNYAIATFSGTGGTRAVGGIIGMAQNVYTETNNYWDGDLSSGVNNMIGNPASNPSQNRLTGLGKRIESSYVGWNFTEAWRINPSLNFGVPYLNTFVSRQQSTPTPANLDYEFVYDLPKFSWIAPTAPALELEGYNIYRNLEFQEYVTTLGFTDEQLTGGDYDYHITAVYKEGESGPVYVNIVIPFNLTAGETDYGVVRVGVNSNKETISIVNTESKDITVRLTFDPDVDFKIDNVSGNGVTWTSGSDVIRINSGATATVTVSFSTLVAGERSAMLYVELVEEF